MKNEARVGIVVVIALTLTVFGYFFLRNLGLATDRYFVRLTGTAIVSPGNDRTASKSRSARATPSGPP